MTRRLPKPYKVPILILMPLLISLACQTLTPGSTANTPAENILSVPKEQAFGPGPFMLADTRSGLGDLSSYKATLTYTFNGTQAGQAEQWTKTYVMLTTKEPAARQITVETTGAVPAIDSVFMAEADGASYERLGENACSANLIEPGNSLADWMEPAGFLTSVMGAEEAGSETVNDVAANHYTFDERALGALDIMKSTGEVWVASDGGYIVKYTTTTTGDAKYFGEGIEGTVTWDYELTDVNQPLTLELPADCPSGMVNAPQLPDATDVVNMPGLLTFTTVTSLADAAAFYQKQIPELGWTLVGDPAITDTTAILSFSEGNQTMNVIIIVDDTGTKVQILLENAQK